MNCQAAMEEDAAKQQKSSTIASPFEKTLVSRGFAAAGLSN